MKKPLKAMPLTDESQMPYGAHKGKKMANVPAEYLLFLYENNKCTNEVKAYIVDNLDVLNDEIKKGKNHANFIY